MDASFSQETNRQEVVKTFVHQSIKSFHKSYKGWLTIYRNKQDFLDILKISILSLVFLFFFGIFLRYINLSSTKGYFFKIAYWELNEVNAKNDIVKLQIIKEKRRNRDNLFLPTVNNLQKKLTILEIPELTEKTKEHTIR